MPNHARGARSTYFRRGRQRSRESTPGALSRAFTSDLKVDIPESPVLLVDDIVDSRWTLTVVAALLRQAGSGAVYPLALAAANAGD